MLQKLAGSIRKSQLFVLLLLVFGALAFIACPMEEDDSEGGPGLDSRLKGTWEFGDKGNGGERYIIDGASLTYGKLHGTGANEVFNEDWAGTIVHAERYTNTAGVIIIKYTKKQVWPDSNSWYEDPPDSGNWVANPLDPQPSGNFYGIYYSSLKTRSDGKLEVKFSNTSDQANSYGPTETETLKEAIEKFTVENMNKLSNIGMSEPVHKVD